MFSSVLKRSSEQATNLFNEITNLNQLICIFTDLHDESLSEEEQDLQSMTEGISIFEDYVRESGQGSFDFFSDLLPEICLWARMAYSSPKCLQIPLLTRIDGSLPESTNAVVFSRKEIRNLLANAYFLNVNCIGTENFGDISFRSIYESTSAWYCSGLGVQRFLCLLSYFHQIQQQSEDFLNQEVSFERHSNSLDSSYFQKEEPLLLMESDVHIHDGLMENSRAGSFVDFANSQIHIGQVIPSLTQEEILFSCCPELFIGLIFVETLGDNEVLVIKNVVRFSQYSGYMKTFKYCGFYDSSLPQKLSNILVMDAVYENHFTVENLLRDINKAFLCFSACATSQVSTGQWGCGVFGGDPTLKFIQQVIAARSAGIQLDFSTFQNSRRMEEFRQIINSLLAKKTTFNSVWKALVCFPENGTANASFKQHFCHRLGLDVSFYESNNAA